MLPFTDDDTLSMAENSGDGRASRAFNVHEVGVRSLNQSLELVLGSLAFVGRI